MEIGNNVHVVTDVYWIPELKNNLFSIGQLQEKGLVVQFQDDFCKVYHDTKGLLFKSKMTGNRMFPVLPNIITPSCSKVTTDDTTHLWHRRYGHLNNGSLRELSQKTMVKGLPKIEESSKICEDCMSGKQHREPFPKAATWRAEKKLQLVHADICGPIKPESNTKRRYFITFIDDFSRKCWVYFLTDKSAALETFKLF